MPYTLAKAFADDLAFLESSCEVCTLHCTLLFLNSFLHVQNFVKRQPYNSDLPEDMLAFKDMYRHALALPTKVLEMDAGEKGIFVTVHYVLRSADSSFFKTIPLLMAEHPEVELMLSSPSLETDASVDDIIRDATAIYAKHYQHAYAQYLQCWKNLKTTRATVEALGTPALLGKGLKRGFSPLAFQKSFRKAELALEKAINNWDTFARCQPTLSKAAALTVAEFKHSLTQRLHTAWAVVPHTPSSSVAARSGRGTRSTNSTNSKSRENELCKVLLERWQDHVDDMEESVARLAGEEIYMASNLATILHRVARHEATSTELRRYIQKKLKNRDLAQLVRPYGFTDIARVRCMPG